MGLTALARGAGRAALCNRRVCRALNSPRYVSHRGAAAADGEPGLHTGEHATAEERYRAAAEQLRVRDKLDREELRERRQQLRAEKKVGAAASRRD